MEKGAKLAELNGFSITGNDQISTTGILVDKGSLLSNATNLIVSNFENGITASSNSSILGSNLTSQSNSAAGFNIVLASYLHAENATSSFNKDGFYTFNNSTILISESTATNNSRYGIYAGFNSHNAVGNSSASSNGDNYFPNPNVFAPFSYTHLRAHETV